MAKQRRARAQPRSPRAGEPRTQAGPGPPPAGQAAGARPKRTSYLEAVALYEAGLKSLQHHDYARATEILRSVLELYPEEKELHERVRLYLNVCARQAIPPQPLPETVQDRVYAATLAINAGAYDEGLADLRTLHDEHPDNDHVLYMLAVGYALRGEPSEAIPHLRRAIALNPENRLLARQDPDLDALRHETTFRLAVESAAATRRDRRGQGRGRSSR